MRHPVRADTAGPGLAQWWTERSAGTPKRGAEYSLWFGPKFDWVEKVTECVPLQRFELEITRADADWTGTKVGFGLSLVEGGTQVRFRHTGWPHLNEHYRVCRATAGRCISGY